MEKKNYNKAIKEYDDEIKNIKKKYKLLDKFDEKYDKSFIHISNIPISIDTLKNTNKNNNSRFMEGSTVYYNPKGFWVSCGTSFYRWLLYIKSYDNPWLDFRYVYKVDINKSSILYIKKLDELINFHKKFSSFKNKKYKINWREVKKEYDGLIICPYLGHKIWGKDPTLNVYLNPDVSDYIEKTLGDDISKYPQFFLEWYRHWDAGSGVIWRNSGIKKISLIYQSNKK